MDASWLLLEKSAETDFARECIHRKLRSLSHAELLPIAERIADSLMAYQQIVRQAAKHIAELDARQMMADGVAVPPPSDWHRLVAQVLSAQTGPADHL